MEYLVRTTAIRVGPTGKQGDSGDDHCMVERWSY